MTVEANVATTTMMVKRGKGVGQTSSFRRMLLKGLMRSSLFCCHFFLGVFPEYCTVFFNMSE